MNSEFSKLGNRALLCSLPVAIVGALFRLMHYPYGNQLLLIGLSSVIIGAMLKYFVEKTIDSYLTGAAISAGCIAVLFKLMHWPNSELLIKIAIGVAIIWGAKTLFFPDKEKQE